jgi:hypothetical protein
VAVAPTGLTAGTYAVDCRQFTRHLRLGLPVPITRIITGSPALSVRPRRWSFEPLIQRARSAEQRRRPPVSCGPTTGYVASVARHQPTCLNYYAAPGNAQTVTVAVDPSTPGPGTYSSISSPHPGSNSGVPVAGRHVQQSQFGRPHRLAHHAAVPAPRRPTPTPAAQRHLRHLQLHHHGGRCLSRALAPAVSPSSARLASQRAWRYRRGPRLRRLAAARSPSPRPPPKSSSSFPVTLTGGWRQTRRH